MPSEYNTSSFLFTCDPTICTHHGLECCTVLECVAACSTVLQRVAVCCSVLQCVAVCCSQGLVTRLSPHHDTFRVCVYKLQHTATAATSNTTLQHTTPHCNTPQCPLFLADVKCCIVLHCVALCCSVLHCAAVGCSGLLCIVTCDMSGR